MINFLICLIISVLLSYGIAILLVEKGNDFPIKKYRVRLQLILSKIHWKAPQILYCETCSVFWICFFTDLVLCGIGLCFGIPYFFWPFSGAIASGVTWTIIEFLNANDKEQNINVFIEKNDIIDIDNDTSAE